MSDAGDARRALLISGAISGDLNATEQEELALLRKADPTVDDEIRELAEVLSLTTTAVPSWDSSAPSGSLRDRVLTGSANPGAPAPHAANVDADHDTKAPVIHLRRRPWIIAIGAAACVAVGAGGVLITQPTIPDPPTGPPGTLGAIEEISFDGEPSGVTIDGSLIAHTWGTETILNISGLTEANPYDVVLVTVGGDSVDSGSFLGSSVEIDCEMNAAVMRESVTSVEIQDESGAVVASAELPAAG
jgi:hypothetical protein